MGAKRTEYQIVGRYMDGKEVTAYHLQSIETGKAGRYSREQVAYLVGRDQITNCIGQIYQDKLLLRGKGMSLEDLPVQQEDGTLKRTDNIGKVRRGTSAADAMEQWMIVGTIKSGKNTVGYVVQNAGCGIKRVKRQQVIELARAGKIGNARVQMYNGNELLRGVNVNLDELPSEVINTASTEVHEKHEKKVNTTRIIIISQLYYSGNSKFEVALVDFAVYNPTLNEGELKTDLERFKATCMDKLGHMFNNTEDVITSTIKGKKCLLTYDDPLYCSIAEYINAANKVNAKFVIDIDKVCIMNDNCDTLDSAELSRAKKELAKLIELYHNN